MPIEEDNPLLTLSNVLITNHVASYSKEALNAISIICAQNTINAYNGKDVLNKV